jgi:hypothetical protein
VAVLQILPDPKVARRGRLGEKYNRELVRYWRAYTTSPLDGPNVVLAQSGNGILPARGDQYVDANADGEQYTICQELVANETDDPLKWVVEARYSSEATNVARENVNPLQELPVIQWGTEVIDEAYKVDLDGNLVQSSSGEPIIDRRERRIRTLTITRNEAAFNDDQADEFQESVNLNAIWGKLPGMVWMYEINCLDPHAFRSGIEYAAVAYKFKIARPVFDPADGVTILNAWDTPGLLDEGLFYLVNGKRQPIMEGTAQVTTPRGLNNGNKLQRTVTDGAITAGSNVLTSLTANFSAADKGGTVVVDGAGTGPNDALDANITFIINTTSVKLSVNAAATVAGAATIVNFPAAYVFPRRYFRKDWSDLALPTNL